MRASFRQPSSGINEIQENRRQHREGRVAGNTREMQRADGRPCAWREGAVLCEARVGRGPSVASYPSVRLRRGHARSVCRRSSRRRPHPTR